MRFSPLSALAALLLTIAPGFSQDGPADRVHRVLEVTGTARQLSDGPNLMRALVASQKPGGDPRVTAILNQAVAQAFDDQAFVRRVEQELLARYDDAAARRILKEYESPVFLAITAREVGADQASLEQAAGEFDWSSLPPARAALFERYVADSRTEERTVALVRMSLKGFLAVLNLALPENRRLSTEVVASLLDQASASVTSDEARQRRLGRLAVLYQDFPDQELAGYLGFCTSPEGLWLSDTALLGLGKAFEECLKGAVNQITEGLRAAT